MTLNNGRPLADLDRGLILEWMASIGSYKSSSRRLYVSTVRSFCRWLVTEGYVDKDPCEGLPRVREARRLPRALNPGEVSDLLTSVDEARMYAVTWLMVGCGLRCVEVSRLDLRDWDRDNHTLLVVGKGLHERTIPIPTPVQLALDQYLTERGDRAGPLILAVGSKAAKDGRLSARWLSKRMARQMLEAGIHAPGDGRTAHALRHTCASDVLEQCRDVRLVQELLGHQSLATTQIYLRRAKLDQLRVAMEGRSYAPLRGVAGAGALSPVAGNPTERHNPSYPATA